MSKTLDILKNWLSAVNTGDVETLKSLYSSNAVLIPTFSNKSLSNPGGITNYFERLGTYKELSVTLREKTLLIQQLDSDKYTLSGIYCWRFIVEKELLNFEARFTFVFDISQDHPIIHHHSSQIPRMI